MGTTAIFWAAISDRSFRIRRWTTRRWWDRLQPNTTIPMSKSVDANAMYQMTKQHFSCSLPTPKTSFMESRIKPIREASTSVEKKPSSPPQVRRKHSKNLFEIKAFPLSADYTKSKFINVALLESPVQSEQYFQSDARHGLDTSSGVVGKCTLQEFSISNDYNASLLGTSGARSWNAEAHQRDWEAAKDPQPELPVDLNADAKL